MDHPFWKEKKVLITGHTGFKGSWLSLWLNYLGADVTGFSFSPPQKNSMLELCRLHTKITTLNGDIRDKMTMKNVLTLVKPDVVFHLVAQALVRISYENPLETYEINVMGTANVLEAVRKLKAEGHTVKAVVNVTSDKCYENQEWVWGYRENEPLGGIDPYSNSKACSELVTSAYRNSFFHPSKYRDHGVGIASARAGNVIGGGDWSKDRLIPDIVRSLIRGETIKIRNPKSMRPWQHVLEPLSGYLQLAQKLVEDGSVYSSAWNFGSNDNSVRTVEEILQKMCQYWGGDAAYEIDRREHPLESRYTNLDCSKANMMLGWRPKWTVDKAIQKIVEWVKAYERKEDMGAVSVRQIQEYINYEGE